MPEIDADRRIAAEPARIGVEDALGFRGELRKGRFRRRCAGGDERRQGERQQAPR